MDFFKLSIFGFARYIPFIFSLVLPGLQGLILARVNKTYYILNTGKQKETRLAI